VKIFIDTANIEEIRTAQAWSVLDGVTTNPSLIAKEKRNYKDSVREICSICPGPVSAEVISLEYDGILSEAREWAKVADNVVVKVPITPDGIRAIKVLASEDIKTNATLCFNVIQALLAAKAGATFVSPFVGRIDDIGGDGMALIAEVINVYDIYAFDTEVIVASIRSPRHVVESLAMGADVATIPFNVLKQLFKHPLTDIGIDRFCEDYRKALGG